MRKCGEVGYPAGGWRDIAGARLGLHITIENSGRATLAHVSTLQSGQRNQFRSRDNPPQSRALSLRQPTATLRTTAYNSETRKESLKSLLILTMFLQTVHNQTQHVVFACLSSRRLLFAVFLHLGISRACLAFSKLDKLS